MSSWYDVLNRYSVRRGRKFQECPGSGLSRIRRLWYAFWMELKRLDAEDLDLVIKTLKEFLAREAPLEKRLKWDAEDHCPVEVVKAMLGPAVGLHLVFLPAECDGMGGGAWDVCRMSCEFAKIDIGLATAMLAVALGSDPIRVGCTPEQQQKWLSRVANEGLIVAYGVTEPGAGSNVQSLATIAERITNDAGEITHYRLNGVKQFISNGSIADLYTILAKTPDGPTFFVVERGTPGLSAGKHEVKHGIRLSDTAQVLLQDVVIPAANLVGIDRAELGQFGLHDHILIPAREVPGAWRDLFIEDFIGGCGFVHKC